MLKKKRFGICVGRAVVFQFKDYGSILVDFFFLNPNQENRRKICWNSSNTIIFHFMKKSFVSLFVVSLSLFGTEPKQVSIKALQKRGEVGNQLYYLPNQVVPFTGKAFAYWPDEKIMTEISYKDGKRHGPKTHWYENGQKLSEINYKNGKHDGPLSSWYENGQWRRRGSNMDGRMVGIWTHWYENGQQRDELFYMGGYMGSAIVWKPNGEKCSMTNVRAGNGVMVKYTEDGTQWLRITYKDGVMIDWRRL